MYVDEQDIEFQTLRFIQFSWHAITESYKTGIPMYIYTNDNKQLKVKRIFKLIDILWFALIWSEMFIYGKKDD